MGGMYPGRMRTGNIQHRSSLKKSHRISAAATGEEATEIRTAKRNREDSDEKKQSRAQEGYGSVHCGSRCGDNDPISRNRSGCQRNQVIVPE